MLLAQTHTVPGNLEAGTPVLSNNIRVVTSCLMIYVAPPIVNRYYTLVIIEFYYVNPLAYPSYPRLALAIV